MKWITEIKNFSQNDNVIIIIVGNKYDLIRQIQVSKEGYSFEEII